MLVCTKCIGWVTSDAYPGSSSTSAALMPLPRALQSFEARAHLTHFISPKLSCRALVGTHRHRTQIPLISFVILSSSTTYHTSSLLYPSSSHFRHRLSPTIMSSTTLARPHSGHSHQHHHHDNTYLVSTNKKDTGVRITRIGLYVNFCMAIAKGLGGYFLNSQSLVADAFHSLTDLVSDFLTLATVSWSLKPPTSRFPGGYGKIESLGSLGVSSLLLAGGIGLGWHSCELLYSQFFLDAASSMAEHDHSHSGGIFGHSHSHNPADMGIPNVHAAWIAGGSITVKEYLYRASKSSLTFQKVLFSPTLHLFVKSYCQECQRLLLPSFSLTAVPKQRLKSTHIIRSLLSLLITSSHKKHSFSRSSPAHLVTSNNVVYAG